MIKISPSLHNKNDKLYNDSFLRKELNRIYKNPLPTSKELLNLSFIERHFEGEKIDEDILFQIYIDSPLTPICGLLPSGNNDENKEDNKNINNENTLKLSIKNNISLTLENKNLNKLIKDNGDKEINYTISLIDDYQRTIGEDFIKLNKINDKKIKREIDIMFNKLSEDLTNLEINGEDYWDINELILRQYTKKSLNKCKSSYLKENIILLLDTSPSCFEYSYLFSKVCSGANTRQDVQILTAPNGIIRGRYENNKLISLDEKIYNCVDTKSKLKKESLHNRWTYDNKTIIFFGDTDGTSTLINSSFYNKIYWFLMKKNSFDTHIYNNFIKKYFKGKIMLCNNEQDFINNMKKIKV